VTVYNLLAFAAVVAAATPVLLAFALFCAVATSTKGTELEAAGKY
jgi:hypothetical protein